MGCHLCPACVWVQWNCGRENRGSETWLRSRGDLTIILQAPLNGPQPIEVPVSWESPKLWSSAKANQKREWLQLLVQPANMELGKPLNECLVCAQKPRDRGVTSSRRIWWWKGLNWRFGVLDWKKRIQALTLMISLWKQWVSSRLKGFYLRTNKYFPPHSQH